MEQPTRPQIINTIRKCDYNAMVVTLDFSAWKISSDTAMSHFAASF